MYSGVIIYTRHSFWSVVCIYRTLIKDFFFFFHFGEKLLNVLDCFLFKHVFQMLKCSKNVERKGRITSLQHAVLSVDSVFTCAVNSYRSLSSLAVTPLFFRNFASSPSSILVTPGWSGCYFLHWLPPATTICRIDWFWNRSWAVSCLPLLFRYRTGKGISTWAAWKLNKCVGGAWGRETMS